MQDLFESGNMQTNHYTAIGADHKVCQDYAASGLVNNVEFGPTFYGIVCDGCSSAPHTEFGAQVITHAAIHQLKVNPYKVPEDFIREVMNRARKAIEPLDINPRCLLATLLLVRADDKDTIVWLWGDGLCRISYQGGTTVTQEVEYDSNAPFYPYYSTTRTERDSYLSSFDLVKRVRHSDVYHDGRERGGEEILKGPEAMLVSGLCVNTADIKAVTVMSDGIKSFQDVNQAPVSQHTTINEATIFKTTTGQYIERRMHAFKQRLCVANGWTHYDDLGIAGVAQ